MATDVAQTSKGMDIRDTSTSTSTSMASEGGYIMTSNEQNALIGFANRLGSCSIGNNEPGIVDETDVRKEARLLMSLSCTSPTNISEISRPTSPDSDASGYTSSTTSSSATAAAARRDDSFMFTCPSLSLENPNHPHTDQTTAMIRNESSSSNSTTSPPPPAELLGRILKVDDRDALRLSAEAMARNVMQSYQKAIAWRIKSWIDSLSKVLVRKEMELKKTDASEQEMKEQLLKSGEAKLVIVLRELEKNIKVMDARTSFKVLAQRVKKADTLSACASPPKKQRMESAEETIGLEETEYKYDVAHTLSFDCFLNITTPAGHVHIDLQVPGTIKGTFLSTEPGYEECTQVLVDLNTDMLAAMIEKSCRIVVRSAVEALLTELSEDNPVIKQVEMTVVEVNKTQAAPTSTTTAPTYTPKSEFSEERVAGLNFVTPRDTSSSSLSSYGDSDQDDKPFLLSIPNDFDNTKSTCLRMVSPQPKRAHLMDHITFTPRTMETSFPSLISPQQTNSKPAFEFGRRSNKGPNLPVLVEVACAAMRAN
jgi:hypothetical protein